MLPFLAVAAPQQAVDSVGAIGGFLFALFYLAIMLATFAGSWKAYEKADQPGWAVIVPIYNFIVMCKIAGRPAWWILLLFVPLVNIYIGIRLLIDFAKSYDKGAGFGLGLLFLPMIFYPMLGFQNETEYVGPAAA